MPFDTLSRCATMPFATSALPFALAATLFCLHFLDDYKRDGFAERAAFGDFYAVAFFNAQTWGAVSVDVTVPSLVPFELWHVELIVASYYNGFVHFGAYDDAV
jgi:uncharacterized membrane protein YwaF